MLGHVAAAGVALVAALSGAAPVAASAPADRPERSEVLVYRWRLEGVQGVLARVLGLLPAAGDGRMTACENDQGRLEVEFKATSEKARESDHWTYQTVVDLAASRTLRVRETYLFRGKKREKSYELEESEVIDVISGLYLLRRSLVGAGRRKIWTGGKVYPVLVEVGEPTVRTVGERELAVRRLTLRRAREPGERKWKARADVWLTDDEAALPVEMLYQQRLGRLRMVLVDPPGPAGPPGAEKGHRE